MTAFRDAVVENTAKLEDIERSFPTLNVYDPKALGRLRYTASLSTMSRSQTASVLGHGSSQVLSRSRRESYHFLDCLRGRAEKKSYRFLRVLST